MERKKSRKEYTNCLHTFFASFFKHPITKFRKKSPITEKFRHIWNLPFTKRHRHDYFGLLECDAVSLGQQGQPQAENQDNTIFRNVGKHSTKRISLNKSSDTPLR